ncbi:MAG: radical SAM protein [Candidatus Omnitrophota bacterium]|nr:MAG: radical SAM protein [Candidatus Omnitrophota bacterium]
MILKKQYKHWSARFHADHSKEPIAVQMELTYRCPLHCVHCYSGCYNNLEYAKKELATKDVKILMDKLYNAGCLWCAFTGGDPMARDDFLELYEYAKQKGFILTLMTNLVALTDEILEKMIEEPPFSIAMTLNGATRETYEKISQVKGSFKIVMSNIDKVLKAKLPLKIKTLLSRNNIHEIDRIKAFVESKGLKFYPTANIYARLNGDTTPCQYRLPIERFIANGIDGEDECGNVVDHKLQTKKFKLQNRFFRCAIGNWQWHIDPYGELNICSFVREPAYSLLSGDAIEGITELADYIKNKRFSRHSECESCEIWYRCYSCPGKAKLEVGDEEAPVPYFCKLAKRQTKTIKM